MSEKSSANKTLESLEEILIASFGDNLVSIVHYGELESANAKIHVLIVVEKLDEADWQRISDAFDRLRGRALVVPMLLTKKSLKSSTDIFPIVIHQIQRTYQVVYGEDVVNGIKIQRSHLRLRCEQELRSLQLQMQSTCLMHFASAHRLRAALIRDCQSLLPLLEVAFELDGENIESAEELMQSVATKFELDEQLLSYARDFAQGGGEFDEETFGGVYVELMAAVRTAADFVDQLPEA